MKQLSVPVIVAIAFALHGCDRRPMNTEAMRAQVLRADPEFATVLERRDELSSRIKVLENELALRRGQVERQIAQLRQGLRETTDHVNHSIDGIKALLNPALENIDRELAEANTELKLHRDERSSLGRSVSSLRKSIKQHATQWTPPERAQKDDELVQLLAEIQRLDHEISGIDAHLRIVRMKRQLLRW